MTFNYDSMSQFLNSFGIQQLDLLAEVSNAFLSFLVSPNISLVLWLKIIFGGISLLMLLGIIFFTLHTSYLQYLIIQDLYEFLNYRPYGTKRLNRSWKKIMKRLDLPDEAEHKLAIVEADDLLNDILERLGYTEGSLSERLAKISFMPRDTIEQVQKVHEMRNKVVHDPNYHLTIEEARKVLEIYQRALRDLQALE